MTEQVYETIKNEKEDGNAWLIMNRPEKPNAMPPPNALRNGPRVARHRGRSRSEGGRLDRRRRGVLRRPNPNLNKN